jgi:hypothetical protein
VEIQEYLIAAIQNIEVLLRYGQRPKTSLIVRVNQSEGEIKRRVRSTLGMIKDFMGIEANGIMSLNFVHGGFNEI